MKKFLGTQIVDDIPSAVRITWLPIKNTAYG
jgi:hypothetical protein